MPKKKKFDQTFDEAFGDAMRDMDPSVRAEGKKLAGAIVVLVKLDENGVPNGVEIRDRLRSSGDSHTEGQIKETIYEALAYWAQKRKESLKIARTVGDLDLSNIQIADGQ